MRRNLKCLSQQDDSRLVDGINHTCNDENKENNHSGEFVVDNISYNQADLPYWFDDLADSVKDTDDGLNNDDDLNNDNDLYNDDDTNYNDDDSDDPYDDNPDVSEVCIICLIFRLPISFLYTYFLLNL